MEKKDIIFWSVAIVASVFLNLLLAMLNKDLKKEEDAAEWGCVVSVTMVFVAIIFIIGSFIAPVFSMLPNPLDEYVLSVLLVAVANIFLSVFLGRIGARDKLEIVGWYLIGKPAKKISKALFDYLEFLLERSCGKMVLMSLAIWFVVYIVMRLSKTEVFSKNGTLILLIGALAVINFYFSQKNSKK